MANPEHVEIVRQGPQAWNRWLLEEFTWDTLPDLSGADLSGAKLSGANLTGAILTKANLHKAEMSETILAGARLSGANLSDAWLFQASPAGADLTQANLSGATLILANLSGASAAGADLTGTLLRGADLTRVDLSEANLSGADLSDADLARADLSRADLSGANLTGARLVETTIQATELCNARVYGVSVWNPKGTPQTQTDLVITTDDEPTVTVDDLEIAQFVYLMLHNEKIRQVIDTVTSKVVLLLGRFTNERKAVLDALREELRHRNLTPVVFDFDRPASKDMTGTVDTLARMARFIVADLTDPSSIPHELATIVPFLRTTPVVLLRLEGAKGYSMVKDLEAYTGWVLPVREYPDPETLIAGIDRYVIAPAEEKLKVLRPREVD